MQAFAVDARYGELPRDLASVTGFAGGAFTGLNNAVISKKGVVSHVGNFVTVTDITDPTKQQLLPGPDAGGVGAVGVSHSGHLLAVGGIGLNGMPPRLLVLDMDSGEVLAACLGGTEQRYSHVAFSPDDELLAAVGSAPDYTLSVWRWREPRMLLRAKAFSQEVDTVEFSPFDPERLVTAGTGHIRFWRMADTFTGLKLQGAIGKFGRVDLSDITSFAMLKDGKTVSTSESGWMLLWEGGHVKVEIGLPGVEPNDASVAHAGGVTTLSLLQGADACAAAAMPPPEAAPTGQEDSEGKAGEPADMCLVSAGRDGWLRVWPYTPIDTADTFDEAPRAAVKPLVELALPRGCKPINAQWCASPAGWLLQDATGRLLHVAAPSQAGRSQAQYRCIRAGHGGAVTALAPLSAGVALTGGHDGQAVLWDVPHSAVVASLRPAKTAPVTVGTPLPECLHGAGAVAFGHTDGVVRVVQAVAAEGAPAVRRLAVFKPHSAAVTALGVSPDGRVLLSAGADGRLFLFSVLSDAAQSAPDTAYRPLGFDRLPAGVRVTSLQIRKHPAIEGAYQALLALDNGVLAVLTCDGREQGSGDTGLEVSLNVHAFSVTLPDMTPPPTRKEQAAARRAAAASESDGKTADGSGTADAGEGADEEDADEEEEPIDPELLRRFTGAVQAAVWSPWSAQIAATGAVSFPVQSRLQSGGDTSESRVVFSCKGDFRQLLLEVALPAMATTGIVPLAGLTEADCVPAPLLCSYANADVQTTALAVCGALLLACSAGGAVTIRHVECPRAYVRADVGSLSAGGIASAALCGQNLFAAMADGAVLRMRVNAEDLLAAARDMWNADVPGLTRPTIAPYPHAHDVPMNPATRVPWSVADTSKPGAAQPVLEPTRADSPSPAGGSAKPAARRSSTVQVSLPVDEAPSLNPAELVGAPIVPARATSSESTDEGDAPAVRSPSPLAEPAQMPPGEHEETAGPAVQHAAADLDGDEVPSLEAARKAKAERAAGEAAEAKKRAMLAKVQSLQAEFESLLARVGAEGTQGFPRTDPSELIVDPDLLALHQTDVEAAVAAVERELAWDAEAARLSVQKLTAAFFQNVDTEPFELKGLANAGLCVKSFPCAQLAKSVAEEASAVRNAAAAADARAPPAARMPRADDSTAAVAIERDPLATLIPAKANVVGNDYEARRTRRMARRAALAHLESQRPGTDDVAPEFAAVLTDAQRDVQDHPLKSEEGFTVEAENRMDASKKHAQIVALDAASAQLRGNFNTRLKTLRALKLRMVRVVRAGNARLREIAGALREFVDVPLPDPELPEHDVAEWPELRKERATAAVLRELGKPVARAPMPAAHPHVGATPRHAGVHTGGAGWSSKRRVRGWQGAPAHLAMPAVALAVAARRAAHGMPALPSVRSHTVPDLARTLASLPHVTTNDTVAQQQVDTKPVHRQRLMQARERITARMQRAVRGFDDSLRLMQRERVLLHRELVAADAWRLTLHRELRMLRRLARQDSALTDKLNQTMREKSSVLAALAECAAARDEKSNELETCRAREAELVNDFRDMVPESAEGGDELLRIFKRRIKRRAPGADDLEDDSDDDNWSSSDDEDSDVEDVCPVGCDQALFDRVLELRETRLDLEEATSDVIKALDDIKRAQDRHTQRQRQIDKEVTAARAEIAQFQKATQAELNTLEVVLPLRASQLFVGSRTVQLLPMQGNAHELQRLQNTDVHNLEMAISAQFGAAGLEKARAAADMAVQQARSRAQMLAQTGASVSAGSSILESKAGDGSSAPGGATNEDVPGMSYLVGATAGVQCALNNASGVGSEPGMLPPTLQHPVLIDMQELQRLRARAQELYDQVDQVSDATHQLSVQRRSMQRQKLQIERGIAELRKKAEDLAFLKFGQTVDMAALDAATGTASHAPNSVEVAKAQAGQHKQLANAKKELEKANSELVSSTRENTQLLERIAALTKEQSALERELAAGAGGSSLASLAQPREVVREAKEDVGRLRQLISVQQAEADALRGEVVVLRSKRSLYAPNL